MSCEESREIDRRAIEEFGLSGIVLMENAGRGCAELLISLGVHGRVVICTGKGNNAGDGFVMARHLESAGHAVKVLLFCSPDQFSGDALVNYRVIEIAKTPLTVVNHSSTAKAISQELGSADWIVDALLGTGTRGQIREPFVSAIRAINAANTNVLAVDFPSGMDGNTGRGLEAAANATDVRASDASSNQPCCIFADHTATIVAPKRGFESEDSKQYLGKVHIIRIGLPRTMLDKV